jgi:pyridoxamine 5'-phosphate oxidase-like protein
MDAHQVIEELEHPGAHDLLTNASLVRLAYNGPDGLPRVIPIGFFWSGEHVVICTATTAPKVRALSDRPEVALTIDVGDTPGGAKALLIRGRASVEIVDGVPHEYLAQSSKGMAEELGEEGMAEFERQVRKTYEQMARIRIEPRWVRFYDFGAGRLPSFLDKLVKKASE